MTVPIHPKRLEYNHKVLTDHICSNKFNCSVVCSCSFYDYLLIVNLLLGLIYRLNLMLGIDMQGRAGIARVWSCLQLTHLSMALQTGVGGVPQKLSDSKRAVIFDDSEYLLVAPQSAVSFQTPIMLTVCISG